MKRILYLFSFFFFTPLLILIILINFLSFTPKKDLSLINPEGGTVLASAISAPNYQSFPLSDAGSIQTIVQSADARPLLIKQYLEKYQSPLTPYADYIFSVSQKYSLDYGLIVAIAQCESNVCKKIPEGSYNCWGFGNGESRFRSWESALEYVAKTIKEDYYDLGLVTPDQMMPKYVPPSVAKGGPWAKCVNQFLEELR